LLKTKAPSFWKALFIFGIYIPQDKQAATIGFGHHPEVSSSRAY
jgi:hypothetical protein